MLNKSKTPEKQMVVHINIRVERDGKTDMKREKRCWIDGKKPVLRLK